MADYTYTKDGIGRVSPENAIAVQWDNAEPLITPERLVDDHLFGIPLVSGSRNPITKAFDVMTPPKIKKFIDRAVAIAQEEAKLDIFPVQYQEKQAFDRVAYQNFGYFQLRHLPVQSLQDLTVTTASEQPVFRVPLNWIDVGYLRQGQINILPLTMGLRDGNLSPILAGPGGAAFLALFSQHHWLAAFWEVVYTTGFKDGTIDKVINEYIGVVAAMEILSALAATWSRTTSNSLGMDGLSQSISGPGPQLYTERLKDLASKRKWLCGRLQNRMGTGIIVNNV